MKVITFMPARNKARVIASSGGVLSLFCDPIIVADKCSESGTKNILRITKPSRVLNYFSLKYMEG